MVHACIITSANLYEVPRPPRRGSHRPGQASSSLYPPLNDDDWTASPHYQYHQGYQGYLDHRGYQDYEAFYDRVRESPQPPETTPDFLSFGSLQDGDDSWKRGGILPARRSFSDNNARHGSLRSVSAGPVARPSWSSYHEQSPTTSDTSPPTTNRRAVSKVRPSLELVRQLQGGVPDRASLEKSILESYARAAPQSAACQSSQKRCLYPGCTKISVSRGLCRGHGGGRRCHVPGCTKSAQSRSNFCWAHGGGQRCDVDGCMRSRKSKHFCVAHLDREGATDDTSSPTQAATTITDHRTTAHRGVSTATAKKTTVSRAASPPVRALPSLGQALSSASRSAPNLPARSIKPFLNV